MYYESCVREIDGKEYLLHASGAEIQDFIRHPKVMPTRSILKDYDARKADHALANGRYPNARGITETVGPVAFVSGQEKGPSVSNDDVAHVGVHRGILHESCTHAFIFDPDGTSLPAIRRRRGALPVLSAHLLTDPRLLSEWSRRAPVFVYREPVLGTDCLGVFARSITTELYGPDTCCSALHFLADHCRCYGLVLCGMDRSFPERRPGTIEMGGRFVYPEHVMTVHQLQLICGVMMRNGMRVSYVKDTMVPVPEAKAIDKERIDEETELLIEEVI